jgi:hypothetical protein
MCNILDKLNHHGYEERFNYDKETSNLQVFTGFINRNMQHSAIPLRSIYSLYTVNVNEILIVAALRRKNNKKI